jgi:hypothetical protein
MRGKDEGVLRVDAQCALTCQRSDVSRGGVTERISLWPGVGELRSMRRVAAVV